MHVQSTRPRFFSEARTPTDMAEADLGRCDNSQVQRPGCADPSNSISRAARRVRVSDPTTDGEGPVSPRLVGRPTRSTGSAAAQWVSTSLNSSSLHPLCIRDERPARSDAFPNP